MMFWLKNLRMSGIQLANTRCWETISNCRERERRRIGQRTEGFSDVILLLKDLLDGIKDIPDRLGCDRKKHVSRQNEGGGEELILYLVILLQRWVSRVGKKLSRNIPRLKTRCSRNMISYLDRLIWLASLYIFFYAFTSFSSNLTPANALSCCLKHQQQGALLQHHGHPSS